MNLINELITVNPFSRPGNPRRGVHALVVHWTNAPGQKASQVRSFYESRKLGKDGYGSAHRGIDFDGSVHVWVPDEEIAYAVGSSAVDPASGKVYTDLARQLFGTYCSPNSSPNWLTMSAEWMTLDDQGNFTDDEYAAGVDQYAAWASAYSLDPLTEILTHHDIIGFNGTDHQDCHRFFVNNPDRFEQFKHDVKDAMGS